MSKNSYTILIPTLSDGGAESMAYQYGKFLEENGHEVKFLLLHDTVDKKYINSKRFVLGVNNLRSSLIRFFSKKFKKDEIFLSLIPYYTILFVLSRYLRAEKTPKIIYTIHNNLDMDFGKDIFSRLFKFIYLFLLRKSNNVYVVSQGLVEQLSRLGVTARPLLNIACYTTNIAPRTPLCSNVRIVVAARLVDQKDYPRAIFYVWQLKQIGVSVTLDIFGDGKLMNELKRLAEIYNISDRVSFRGYQEDLERILELEPFDVLLLTSRYEGFGLVLVEALKKGIYPIARDCNFGPSEIIRKGVGSLLPYDFDGADVVESYNSWRAWASLDRHQRSIMIERVVNHIEIEALSTWGALNRYIE